MQARMRYPRQYRLLLGLGGLLTAAFIMLIFTPLLQAYSLAFGIPLLTELAFAMAAAAMLLLCLGLPLGGGWGCAGLLLEWMGRRQDKRKRKFKREYTAGDQGRLANAEQRLSASGMRGLAASDPEARLRTSCIVHKEKSKVHKVERLR